jgi:excisionase family DNA binding protein
MNEYVTQAVPGIGPPGPEHDPIQEVWIADSLTPDVHHERFRVAEVSHLLGISIDRIRHAVRAGELTAERVGQDIVCIHRTDLLAWLETQGPGV